MIRPALIKDLPILVTMGKKFYDASGMAQWFDYDQASVRAFLTDLIESNRACLFVAEFQKKPVGAIGGMFYPCYFNRAHLTGHEFFWWLDPEFRGGLHGLAMLRALEKWALANGCITNQMGALEAQKPDEMIALYRKLGYAPKEYIFCKRLTDA